MDAFQFVDIFSTKGIEYILVVTFLLLFILFWRLLNKPVSLNKSISPEMIPNIINFNAFKMAEDYYYHPGHSWLRVNDQNVVTVGLDDFAVKLMGKPESILLPEKDQLVRQGDKAWSLKISGESIEMLSPVNGRVTEINEEALTNPSLVSDSPYERGWLLKIEPSNISGNIKNLLKGNYAKAWLEETINSITSRFTGNLGVVMQDGGSPVEGFARELDTEKWDDIIKEYMLTD
jgi:glycine cleavage system H lipoate-binding protein